MKEILANLDRMRSEGEDLAIATLVRVRGSAPRRAGARLCVSRAGTMVGSVSGGCVENDVYRRAIEVMDDGGCALARYSVTDDMDFQVGLSCGGRIEVLIEPLVADPVWEALAAAVSNHRSVVLCTALAPDSLLGRKRLLLADGNSVGSIAPELDAQLQAGAEGLPESGSTRNLTLRWRDDEATVFLESFASAPQLFIVGGTHGAIPICRMATELGFRVTVIDAREPFAKPERFPEAEQVLMAWPDEAFDQLGLEAGCYVISLAHDPKFDVPAITRALQAGAAYIGAMGSRGTCKRRLRLLREAGISETDLRQIRAPIGLDLGGQSPEETAVAIVAEMLAVRYGRDGGPLASGAGSIHAPATR
jgi:xanthine dehydrogenase accessory factor